MSATSTLRYVTVAMAIVVGTGVGCKKKPDESGLTLPPSTTVSLASVVVAPSAVAGGGSVGGTVSLDGAATSATAITLQSSNTTAATVTSPVTIAGGASTANFSIGTSAVSAVTPVTITASLGSVSRTAPLTVNPVLAANFVVRALSPSIRKTSNSDPGTVVLPAGALDACPLVNTAFDCQFDASTSTANPGTTIVGYRWTYFVGARQRTEPDPPVGPDTTPIHKPTESSCNFFGGITATNSGGLTFISMRVDLEITDSTGTKATKSTQNVRVFPANQCGGGF